ncbi:MAG: XRE family transcriptional regulator [Motiliproteus sp.]|nr:XRE family transcriptional regulator [Motiliproteus sp.]MCW9053571.1 XRE family transcriptional regulator [Motiliproteus sp.]
MEQLKKQLALSLKKLRSERGWSLDRTAIETGVSKAMLGQIEREESSPTLATLWKIARGFHVSMSSLTEPDFVSGQQTVYRSSDEVRTQPTQDNMLVASLFPFEPQFGFEFFELTLLPGYQRESDPHEPGVVEHVVVVSGEMELLVEGKWQPLKVGSAVRFAGDSHHGYRNLHDEPAVFHNLICYPKTGHSRSS